MRHTPRFHLLGRLRSVSWVEPPSDFVGADTIFCLVVHEFLEVVHVELCLLLCCKPQCAPACMVVNGMPWGFGANGEVTDLDDVPKVCVGHVLDYLIAPCTTPLVEVGVVDAFSAAVNAE